SRLIALTGYALAEDVERALAAGFDAHLSKPVSLQRLREALAGVALRGGEGRAAQSAEGSTPTRSRA
ncbi:MAG: hypothetical protein KC420_11680, partial [Myxococcales bacterium]|nr:hypothetical protein [Myxococcales bacterium]